MRLSLQGGSSGREHPVGSEYCREAYPGGDVRVEFPIDLEFLYQRYRCSSRANQICDTREDGDVKGTVKLLAYAQIERLQHSYRGRSLLHRPLNKE